MSAQEIYVRYRKNRWRYKRLVDKLKELVVAETGRAGIACQVVGRAKTLDSFIKKVIRDGLSYDNVYDKAGVRVILTYPDDRERLAELIASVLDVRWSKDFDADAHVAQFGYRGMHFTVAAPTAGRPRSSASLVAELQIHTPGAALWASVGHDLVYKTHQTVPPDVARSFNRLSALLELVDTEMALARERILREPGAAAARTLSYIEKTFLSFRATEYDPRLSLTVLNALEPVTQGFKPLADALDTFVAEQREKLSYIYGHYRDDFRHVMLSQPESLVLFFLFDQEARPEVEQHWPQALPESMLDALTSVWMPNTA